MQTIQATAFVASKVDRDQEIALGEQIQVWRKAKADGITNPKINRQGENAVATLVEVNQRYLPNVLKKYFGYSSIDNDELWTTGFLGLVQAANSYNPAKGYFWYFARKFVHGEVQDLLRKNYAIILPKGKFAKAQNDPALKALLIYTDINDELLGEIDEYEDEGWNRSIERLGEAIVSLPPNLREIIERVYEFGREKATQTVIAQERGVSNAFISKQKKAALRLIKRFLERSEAEIRAVEEVREIEVVAAVLELPEPEVNPLAEVLESGVVEAVQENLETKSAEIETALEVKAVESVMETETVQEVKKGYPLDTIGLSPIGTAMKCLNCSAYIPKPLEGIKVGCSLCSARYECDEKGSLTLIKRRSEDAPIVYKDQSLDIPPMSKKEIKEHESSRIVTLNDLAEIYAELEGRGAPFDGVRTHVLNLWRETTEYRLFDESAMDRVDVWIEEVENDLKRNTA